MSVDGVYYDAYNALFGTPGGVTDGVVWFQANDEILDNNSGTISFHVKVCRLAVTPSTITISYTAGSGVETLPPGDSWIVNMTSEDTGGINGNSMQAVFSEQVHITVQSTSGFVNRCTTSCAYASVNVGGTPIEIISEPNPPTSQTPGLVGDGYNISTGNATGTPSDFTVKLLIERV